MNRRGAYALDKVPARSAVKTAIQTVKRLKPATRLEILSFKKDRRVQVERADDGSMTVTEDGFVRQQWQADDASVQGILKDVIPREFPRSHELRFTVRNLQKQ